MTGDGGHSKWRANHSKSTAFIHVISIVPLPVHYYSLRSAPDAARILCQSCTPKRHRQLRA